MIDGELTAAIAYLQAGGQHGTAFLVSATGLVLTARHCVEGKGSTKDKVKWINPPVVDLRFGDIDNPILRTTAPLPPVDHDYDEDWALLQCKPVPNVTPISLAEFDPSYDQWETFGFPQTLDTNKGNRGQVYDGTVVSSSGALQLTVNQSGPKTMSAGISGSALLIGREAVGVIIESLRDADGINVEGTLWARPLNVPRLRAQGLMVSPQKVFYQEQLPALIGLDEVLARSISDSLKMPVFKGRELLIRAVARQLLTSRIARLKQALGTLASRLATNPRAGYALGRLLAASHLPSDALVKARSLLLGEPPKARRVGIQWTEPLTAELHAAGVAVEPFASDLSQRVFVVSPAREINGRTIGEALLAEVCTAMGDRLGLKDASLEKVREEMDEELGDVTFFVVVVDAVSPDDLLLLEKEFPRVRILVRSDRTSPTTPDAGPPPWEVISPALTTAEETDLRNAFNEMPKILRKA